MCAFTVRTATRLSCDETRAAAFRSAFGPCATAWAQETVAPTVGETTLPPRGEDAGNYNVVQSWELGYRFATIGGDEGKYRSDVNFGNGVRLLSSYLTINST